MLERPIDPKTLYPELSLNQNYTEVLNSFNWASPHQKYVSSCYSMEWSNSITRFLPAIAEYNRQSQSKVQVISLDGHSTEDFGENLKSDPILEIPEISDKSNCQPQGSLPYRYVKPNSPIREQRTAVNFTRFIKDRKSDKKKVVVLYHQGHLMRLGTQCRILATDSATFEASIGPGPFPARLWETEKLSEISSVVFIDEPGTSNAPNGHTKIAARGGTLRLGQSFAVQPNALSGVDQMKGSTMFMPGSDLTLATVKPFNKSYQIKDFFDLIIWVTGDQAKVLTRVVLPGCENSTPL